MPVRLNVWGLLESLSVIVRVPVRGPAAVGVKVTVTVHHGIGVLGTYLLKDIGQSLAWEKSPVVLMHSLAQAYNSANQARKASWGPPSAESKGANRGKSVDAVQPVSQMPLAPIARLCVAPPYSRPLPPR